VKRRHPVLLGSALALVAASPAAAATVEVKGLDTLLWDQSEVRILPGDSVVWSFDGTTQAHNVKADSANWPTAFRSELGVPAPRTVPYQFTTTGAYRFVCEVHPDTMWGNVIVGDAPPPPPPPPGDTPFPNDTPEPTAYENKVGLDGTKPALRAVSVKRSGRRAKVSFRVSEAADVTVWLKRGRKVVRTRHVSVSGRAQVTVGGKALRAGRYRVELSAVDIAGNRSSRKSARITLR
jgi:plastocyanin